MKFEIIHRSGSAGERAVEEGRAPGFAICGEGSDTLS